MVGDSCVDLTVSDEEENRAPLKQNADCEARRRETGVKKQVLRVSQAHSVELLGSDSDTFNQVKSSILIPGVTSKAYIPQSEFKDARKGGNSSMAKSQIVSIANCPSISEKRINTSVLSNVLTSSLSSEDWDEKGKCIMSQGLGQQAPNIKSTGLKSSSALRVQKTQNRRESRKSLISLEENEHLVGKAILQTVDTTDVNIQPAVARKRRKSKSSSLPHSQDNATKTKENVSCLAMDTLSVGVREIEHVRPMTALSGGSPASMPSHSPPQDETLGRNGLELSEDQADNEEHGNKDIKEDSMQALEQVCQSQMDRVNSQQGTGVSKPAKRTKLTAEERESLKKAKALEKTQAQQAKCQEKAAMKETQQKAKLAQREERDLVRRANGSKAEEEVVVLLDHALATQELGWEVMRRLKEDSIAVEVGASTTVAASTASGGQPNSYGCFTWKRRVPRGFLDRERAAALGVDALAMTMSQGASQQEVASGDITIDVPYMVLVVPPVDFLHQLLSDRLSGILTRWRTSAPNAHLGILVIGLDLEITRRERADFKKGPQHTVPFSRKVVDNALADVMVQHKCISLYIDIVDNARAADRLSSLTRAIAYQPYTDHCQYISKFGGTRNSEAIKRLEAEAAQGGAAVRDWWHALMKVPHVAPASALAVANKFPSLGSLLTFYMDPTRSAMQKQKGLVGLPEAGGTGRCIGINTSKRLFKVLCETTDPDALLFIDDD